MTTFLFSIRSSRPRLGSGSLGRGAVIGLGKDSIRWLAESLCGSLDVGDARIAAYAEYFIEDEDRGLGGRMFLSRVGTILDTNSLRDEQCQAIADAIKDEEEEKRMKKVKRRDEYDDDKPKANVDKRRDEDIPWNDMLDHMVSLATPSNNDLQTFSNARRSPTDNRAI